MRIVKVTSIIWPAELCTHHGLPMVKASAMGGIPTQCLLDVGVAEEGGGRAWDTISVPRAGQVTPEAALASGPRLEEWVTLYFLHLSGKGDDNSRGLLPLESDQGPGIPRARLASHMEHLPTLEKNGQH